ncbi:MAG TPA: hypothetical protein PLF23_16720, partial [Candidatus Obscuribacter sp.]|nr:hypothetical protein [Candidatus Obscuribacter sp.]
AVAVADAAVSNSGRALTELSLNFVPGGCAFTGAPPFWSELLVNIVESEKGTSGSGIILLFFFIFRLFYRDFTVALDLPNLRSVGRL